MRWTKTVSWRSRSINALIAVGILVACSDTHTIPSPSDPSGQATSPAAISIVSGNNQVGTPNVALLQPIVVRVTDAAGQPVWHVPVEFVVTTGGGRTATAVEITDASGQSSELWTLGPTPQSPQTLEIRALDTKSGQRVAITSASATTAAASAPGDTSQTTPTAPPAPATTPASAVSSTSATLNATIASTTIPTNILFEFANDAALANPSRTPSQTVAASASPATVSLPLTGLSAATTYYFRALAFAGGDTTRGQTLSFSTGAAEVPNVAPQAPSALFATTPTAVAIQLSWADNSTTETSFSVERADAAPTLAWAVVATLPANTTQFTDADVRQATTYLYRIRACATACSDYTPEVRATLPTTQPSGIPGAIPSSLVGTYDPATGAVRVTWQYALSDATYFSIRRNDELGSPPLDQTFKVTIPNGQFAYVDLQVLAEQAHAYKYTMQACNSLGCGALSQPIHVTTPRLEPPTSLAAVVASGQVTLTWHDNSANEAAFGIFKRDVGGAYGDPIATLAASTTTYTTPIAANVTEYFVVRAMFPATAVAGFNRSLPSNEVIASTVAGGKAPTVTTLPPTDVYQNYAALHASVVPNSLPTTMYFEYSTDPSFASVLTTPIVDAGAGTAAFFPGIGAEPLVPNSTYYYRAVATNSAGITRGASLSFRTAAPSLAPTGVTATYDPSTGNVKISWSPPSQNEVGRYSITRTENGGDTLTTVFNSIVPPYSDGNINVSVGHSFTYAVAACDVVGCGPAATPVSVTTPLLPAPSNLTINVTADGTVTLNWTDNSSNESGFSIYSRPNSVPYSGTGYSGMRVAANVTSYTTTIAVGTTRYFVVRAMLPERHVGDQSIQQPTSAPSNEVLATTPAPVATPLATTSVVNQVTHASAALHAVVVANGAPTVTYFEYGTSATLASPSRTADTDAGSGTAPFEWGTFVEQLTPNTTYYFRVVATNSAGTSRGQIASFTTLP